MTSQQPPGHLGESLSSGKARDAGSVYRLRVEALSGGYLGLRARRPQRWNPLFPQLPGKRRVRGTREGKGRALLSSDQSRVPHLCPGPCPTPTAQSSSLPSTCDPAPPPHFASRRSLRRPMPAPSSFPGRVLWGLLKGQGVAICAWPTSLHLLPRPSPTAGQGALLPLPASLEFPCLPFPQRTELSQPHKAQAAENPPRPLKVPVLGGTTDGSWLVEASGYPEMLYSDHQGPCSGSRVQGQEGKVPHML